MVMEQRMFARRQLQAFVSVAELGSFTRAAEYVHLSQPALSSSIRKLETLLGIALFTRDTRSVTLTSGGRHFLGHAQRILADMDQALEDARDMAHLRQGRLRLAVLPSVASSLLPGVMARFCERHPQVDISVRDGLAGDVQAWVCDASVDIGLTSRPEADSALDFQPLWQDELIAVVPASKGAGRDWQTCSHALPYIALTAHTSIRPLADRALKQAGLSLVPGWELAQMSSAIAMVREGLGYTLLPASCIEVFNLGAEVVTHRVEGVSRELGCLWRRPVQPGPVIEAFMALLQESIDKVSGSIPAPVLSGNPE